MQVEFSQNSMNSFLNILIIILLATVRCTAQEIFSIRFPDSLKTSNLYYRPSNPTYVNQSVLGLWKFGTSYNERLDKIFYYDFQSVDPPAELPKFDRDNEGSLLIMVDAVQEVDVPLYFNKTFKYKGYHHSPRKIYIFSQDKCSKIRCNDDTTILFKGMAVYVINNNKEIRPIPMNTFSIMIVQQAMDKNGHWIDIERLENGIGCRTPSTAIIEPGEMLLTIVPIYKGSFKTLGRIKLAVKDKMYYSKPFHTSVNPDLFNFEKRTIVREGALYEK